MKDPQTNPFVRWQLEHPRQENDRATNIRISQWVRVNHEFFALFDIADDVIIPWSEGRTSTEPDFVAYIAGYGYSRLVTGDWQDLPINIPASEYDDWEENSGMVYTLEKLRAYQAGVASAIPQALYRRTDDVVKLINEQLTKRYDELRTLAAQSLDSFSPTQWSDDELYEDEAGHEIKQLDRIFDLYEELWCFEQGIEELRMLMISEDDAEFRLPNSGFYAALVSIDSHELLATLKAAEPKLKAILTLWAKTTMTYSGKPYHRPYDEAAPGAFWWRHQQRTPRAQNHPPRQGAPRRRRPNQ